MTVKGAITMTDNDDGDGGDDDDDADDGEGAVNNRDGAGVERGGGIFFILADWQVSTASTYKSLIFFITDRVVLLRVVGACTFRRSGLV